MINEKLKYVLRPSDANDFETCETVGGQTKKIKIRNFLGGGNQVWIIHGPSVARLSALHDLTIHRPYS